MKSIRMSDQPRADAVRYRDPAAERYVRRFLRPPQRPPMVALPGGGVAPQSGVRAYAPMLDAGQQTVYIDCVNEAATDTWSAAELDRRIHWQPVETFAMDGRSFSFERGYFATDAVAASAAAGAAAAITPREE